jgi:hypothetical protein
MAINLTAPFRMDPSPTRTQQPDEPKIEPAQTRPAQSGPLPPTQPLPSTQSTQPAQQGWVKPKQAPPVRQPSPATQTAQARKAAAAATADPHAAMGTFKDKEFSAFFKDGWISVKDLQDRANAVGRGPEVAKAIAAADLDGDGKISGEEEGLALFKQLDKFDHDGSRHTISLHTQGLQEWLKSMEKNFHSNDEGDGVQPSGHLQAGGKTTSTPTADCDTLTPVQNEGSSLVNGQRLGRRYSGSGPVEVTTANGRVQAFQYKGGMNVDTDGGTSRLARSDPDYQSNTSMNWAGRKALNADNIPFIVLPPSLAAATGAKLGDLVQVEKNGKSMYAIYGDVGPSMKLGEASLMLAKGFDPRASPRIGIDGGVTTTVLPGSGARFGLRQLGPQHSAADIQKLGQQAFDEARQKGFIR